MIQRQRQPYYHQSIRSILHEESVLSTTMEGDQPPHLLFMPYMAQGHMIPMVDMARLFARRGASVTIVTTPANAARFAAVIDREFASGVPVRFHTVAFPTAEAGLPEGCETLDFLPSGDVVGKFFAATAMWRDPVEAVLQRLTPKPVCVVADVCLPWTSKLAHNLGIPKFVFSGISGFAHLCVHNIHRYKLAQTLTSDWQPFSIPGLPEKFKFTRAQVPDAIQSELDEISKSFLEGAETAYGVVLNTFAALEHDYVVDYGKAVGKKVWALGPFSLCNVTAVDKADRGNKSSNGNSEDCLRWLDSKDPKSVVYVCFGSLSHLKTSELMEVGLGLEASRHNFIWVVRLGKNSQGMERWLEEGKFEERVKGRGLVIKGWAPQVLILSHPSIGAFFTHCGWNSTLEGVCAGVPMVTWPMFADQFFNEKVMVDMLDVGVSVGVKQASKWGREEEVGGLVDREMVRKAVEVVLDEGEEGEERRRRAKELAEKAKEAIEVGGTSYKNVDLFLEDVLNYAK